VPLRHRMYNPGEGARTLMFIKKRPIAILFAAVTFAAGAPRPQSESKVASLEQLNLRGEGAGTSTSSGGSAQGAGQANLFGATTFALSFVNAKLLGDNGIGGTCSIESGDLQLTAGSQGTITMSQVGTSCNVSGANSANTLNATFLVTQGTGQFQGITGTGSVVVGFSSSAGQAGALITLNGILQPAAP